MTTRRKDVFSRMAAGTARRSPEKEAIRASIQRLTGSPDWAVLLDYLDHRERALTAISDELDSGALLRAAGRRTVLRELERLDERVIDDDRSGTS